MSGSTNSHARKSPSSSKQWIGCTASIGYIEANAHRIPADDSSDYSREGTQAHEWAEKLLNGEIQMEEIPFAFRLPLGVYYNHCRSLVVEHPEAETFVEVESPLFYDHVLVEKTRNGKTVMQRPTGTCDFALVTEDRVVIRDLKYGAGVPVSAEENTQLAIYALSLVRDLQSDGFYSFTPDTVIDIGIVQPRYTGDEPIKLWVTTLYDLEKFCEHIEAAAVLIDSGGPVEFGPGNDTCRWCAARAFCSARAESLLAPLGAQGVDLLTALPDLTKAEKKLDAATRVDISHASAQHAIGMDMETLSDEQLVALYAKKSQVSSFFSDIEEYLATRLNGGEQIDGLKLVEGRQGNRAWVDEESADKLLKKVLKFQEDRYDFKLISVAQAEKKVAPLLDGLTDREKKNFVCKWDANITRSDGKPVMALADDKRPSISPIIHALPDLENDGLGD